MPPKMRPKRRERHGNDRLEIPLQGPAGGTLKEAEARLIKAVGVERAADLLGIGRSQVYRFTDPAEPDAHLGVDRVRILEGAASDPMVTAFLAAEAGCALLDLRNDSVDGDVPRDVAAFADKSSALYAAWAQSLSDGVLEASEAGELVAKVDRTMGSLAQLRAELVAKQRGQA
jgi:hypothetical protein